MDTFADMKKSLIKSGVSEKEFDDVISPVETKLLAAFPAIKPELLRDAIAMWVMLQSKGQEKISFMTTSYEPNLPFYDTVCIICRGEPFHVAAYFKKDSRALIYFACDEHWLGNVKEKSQYWYDMTQIIENVAEAFYEERKKRGIP